MPFYLDTLDVRLPIPPCAQYEQVKWVFVAGDMDPPSTVRVCKKQERDKGGSFLVGQEKDLALMTAFVAKQPGHTLHKVFRRRGQHGVTVREVKNFLGKLGLDATEDETDTAVAVYYTGHGEQYTGDWCLSDGAMTMKDIDDFGGMNSIQFLMMDSCYAGSWATDSRTQVASAVLSASDGVAWDTLNGGSLTLWWLKKESKCEENQTPRMGRWQVASSDFGVETAEALGRAFRQVNFNA
eukprot:NODE_383_length_942_cov_611.245241_g333_i0.p1 GENE.NODE_383_length_942_cov_611.245241_g333_i0~~NODE_383_length_942_cov_611.245241_g333_i0.p1  ORF type:complete len:239 (-),score=56.04 NODE_383_length_942_cov_611.245241_g333_i0:214-930(-)